MDLSVMSYWELFCLYQKIGIEMSVRSIWIAVPAILILYCIWWYGFNKKQ